MTNKQQELEFLKARLETLRDVYKWLKEACPQDIVTPSKKKKAEWEAKQERAARVADAYGFDGSIFRTHLLETYDDDPLSLWNMKALKKQIVTIPRIIAKMEEVKSEVLDIASHRGPNDGVFPEKSSRDHDEEDISVSDGEIRILRTLSKEFPRQVKQQDIASDQHKTRSVVRPHLRTLAEKGLIERPPGTQRYGYRITAKGKRILDRIPPDEPRQ